MDKNMFASSSCSPLPAQKTDRKHCKGNAVVWQNSYWTHLSSYKSGDYSKVTNSRKISRAVQQGE
jgi:hypothetical protein